MGDRLHITNGDSATSLMRAAGLDGEYLPWRDLLHQGPVPQGLDLTPLSECRADYIASLGWGDAARIRQDFLARDQQLRSANEFPQVVLWFEHDLYDQLQLLQLLAHFHHHPHPDLNLICTDQYLGQQSPDQLLELQRFQHPVTPEQLKLGASAWSAFRDPDPSRWFALLKDDNQSLPFLNDAVRRMLQEYPSRQNGLSRSAEQALRLAADGIEPAADLFRQSQALEQQVFMGDASFWQLLQQLVSGGALKTLDGAPLLDPITSPPTQAGSQRLQITELGQGMLVGQQPWWQRQPIDHWIGGVHLQRHNLWCWDSASESLVRLDQT